MIIIATMKRILIFTILLACYVQTFSQNWISETISTEGIKPSLAVDEMGSVHIAFMLESNSGWVRHALVENGTVTINDVVVGYFYGPLDIAIGNDNRTYIAYHDHTIEDQVVAIGNGNAWGLSRTSDIGHDGWDNSIVVDENNVIHTSSIDPSGFRGNGLEYARFQGASWRVEEVGSGPIMYANATSLALDSEGGLFISYFDDGEGTLKLASKASDSWGIETIDNSTASGRFSSIFINSEDDIFISYYKDNGEVRLASCINESWSIKTIDKLDNVEIGFLGARNLTSIDGFGDVIGIAYADKSIVKLARLENGEETIEQVAEASNRDFGQIVSMKFDKVGIPHISYSDLDASGQNGNILYAARDVSVPVKNIETNEIALNVFPNPIVVSESKLYIQGSIHNWNNYKIYDLKGSLIQKGEIPSTNEILLKIQSPGTYIAWFGGSSKHSATQKIVLIE